MKFKRHLRATSRLPLLLGTIGRGLWDVYVRKVDGEKKDKAAHRFYHGLLKSFGMKYVFNEASVGVEQNYPTILVSNHGSTKDWIILGAALNTAFAGSEIPIVKKLQETMNYVGIKRVPKDHPDFRKYVRRALGRLIENLNNGINTLFHPEGTTTDGTIVAQPRAALIKMAYGEAGLDKDDNEISLEGEMRVQGVAMKLLDVEGYSMEEHPEKRHYFSHHATLNSLKRIWTRLATESITIELTVLPSQNPADYADEKELINSVFNDIRQIVAPNQTVVEPARIPGVAERGEDPSTSPPKRGLF